MAIKARNVVERGPIKDPRENYKVLSPKIVAGKITEGQKDKKIRAEDKPKVKVRAEDKQPDKKIRAEDKLRKPVKINKSVQVPQVSSDREILKPSRYVLDLIS